MTLEPDVLEKLRSLRTKAFVVGLVGALVALPIAAALLLLIEEVLFPRLDRAKPNSGTR